MRVITVARIVDAHIAADKGHCFRSLKPEAGSLHAAARYNFFSMRDRKPDTSTCYV